MSLESKKQPVVAMGTFNTRILTTDQPFCRLDIPSIDYKRSFPLYIPFCRYGNVRRRIEPLFDEYVWFGIYPNVTYLLVIFHHFQTEHRRAPGYPRRWSGNIWRNWTQYHDLPIIDFNYIETTSMVRSWNFKFLCRLSKSKLWGRNSSLAIRNPSLV
jgi:hypothetical protein